MGCTPSRHRVEPTGHSVSTSRELRKAAVRNQTGTAVDPSAFKRIDEHARKAPAAAAKSLQSLADYLGSAATSDLEKARAVYKWVTANIDYDADGYYGRKARNPTDAESVLKNRSSVCDGYASLTLSLCQLMGVECKKLTGYAKGVSYNPKNPITTDTDTNHAWNVVKLGGKWHFLECTWGAGHMSNKKVFERKETDFYFLTDPEAFVEAHFPYMDSNMKESMKWQLLDKPIDLNTFQSRVKRYQSCFEHKVELVSHNQALIDVSDEVAVKFKGTGKALTGFSAHFVNGDTGQRENNSKYTATVLDHRTNEATVTARPPTSGTFWELQVFGTTVEDPKSSDMLVSYQVRAKTQGKLPDFPDGSNFYGLHRNPEKCGFTKEFWTGGYSIKAKGGQHELKIPISGPVAVTTSLESADGDNGKEFCFREIDNEFLKISVRMRQAGFYKLTLFSKETGASDNTYHFLACFLIMCPSPLEQAKPFPEVYGSALDNRVTLDCPRDGLLPANSEVRFKLRSGQLSKLLLNSEVKNKENADTFDCLVKTGASGEEFCVFGAADESAKSFTALYKYKIA